MRREPYKEMNCSVAAALHVIGEPWTFLVIRDAFLQVRRFEEFQKNLGIGPQYSHRAAEAVGRCRHPAPRPVPNPADPL